MRRVLAALGIISATFFSQTALANEVFVIGPGMLGHPADDASVSYSALALEEKLGSGQGADPTALAGVPPRPWEQAWFQLNEMPGV
jgi:hypothetical protein